MNPGSYRKVITVKHSRRFREATQIVEEPFPVPGPDEVTFKVLVASANASDVLRTDGFYGNMDFPFGAGLEAVGQIAAVGDNVSEYQIGDYVACTDPTAGCFAEYKVAHPLFLLSVPEPRPEFAAFMAAAGSASVALEVAGEMKSDETILVTAAAGSVGTYAVQMAKQAGNHVIGTCGSNEKAALLRELGCDRVINYRNEDVGAVLRAEYENGIDLVFESVGGDMFEVCLDHLAVRGRLLVFGYVSEYVTGPSASPRAPVYSRLLMKSASIRGFAIDNHLDKLLERRHQLLEAVSSKTLRAVIDPTKFQGIESVVDAVEYVHSGKNCGKVQVHF